MSQSSSCSRCRQPLAVESASGLCDVCARDTSRPQGTPSSDDGNRTRSQAQGPDGATFTAGFLIDTPTKDPAPSPMRLRPSPPGHDLIRYVDRGGMGDVYVAREHFAQRVVAVKFLRPAASPSNRDRFLREIKTLGSVDHPHIVRIFSADADRDDPYYSMEYCAGGSLADRIKAEGPYPPEAAARIGIQLADALAAVHRVKTFHRDVKPSNVVLTADGVPKLSDFGLAKIMDETDDLTRTTQAIGTPAFMPPEQITRDLGEYGPHTDVYGLGATLYAMLTGKAPFAGDSNEDILLKVKSDMPTRPRVHRPDVPMGLEAVVLKCLEKRPADRYSTAEELAKDLERCLEGRTPPPRRWRPRVKRWIRRYHKLVAVLLAFMIAITSAMIWWPKLPDPVNEIRKELAAGRAVALVGETGLPRVHHSILEKDTLDLSPLGDGTASFHAFNVGLIELFPDPGREHYRVDLQLRQLQSRAGDNPQGPDMEYVGFYFGYSELASETSIDHAMFALTFKDYPPPVRNPPKKTPQRAVFFKALEFYVDQKRITPTDSGNIAALRFTPKAVHPGDWRPISVEFTEEGVGISWLDDPPPLGTGTMVTVGRFGNDELREKYAAFGKSKLNLAAAPIWSSRMPFGVLSHRASVAIRNVVITPLP